MEAAENLEIPTRVSNAKSPLLEMPATGSGLVLIRWMEGENSKKTSCLLGLCRRNFWV